MLKTIINNKNLIITILVLIILFIGTISFMNYKIYEYKHKYEKTVEDLERARINLKASNDSIRIKKDENDKITASILSYKLTIDELNNDYKNLFSLYQNEKNKKPKVIIETKYKIIENLVEIPTFIKDDSIISLYDSVYFGDGNYRILDIEIPYSLIYRIKKDSVYDFELQKALKHAFNLNNKGINNAFVVIYDNNRRIDYNEYLTIQNLDSINYRVQILSSNTNYSIDEIGDKFNINKDFIGKTIENDKFIYTYGIFKPKKNIEPLIDIDDINIFTQLKTFNAITNLNISMNLATALIVNENNELEIQVQTKYPGIIFESIVGAEILDNLKKEKKYTQQFRREWGIGINAGYGFMILPENELVIKRGPTFSVGVNYTPRWLQFR